MPEKQNENKFMAMLERTGIVRRADSEDEPIEKEPVAERSRPEADLRSIFGPPGGDSAKAASVPRQPVPGMPSPVMPGERTSADVLEQARSASERPIPELVKPLDAASREAPKPPAEAVEPEPAPSEAVVPEIDLPPTPIHGGFKPIIDDFSEDREPVESIEPDALPEPFAPPDPVVPVSPVAASVYEHPSEPVYSQPEPAYTPAPEPVYRAPESAYQASDSEYSEAEFDYSPPEPVYAPPEPPPIESYTDRFMEVDDLYDVLNLRIKGTDTIYLIEEYLKTLPDSLPDQSRRDIISKIVAASGFDYDLLTGDGILRVKMLKDYAEKFARYTDGYVQDRHDELEELEQQMLRVRKMIENRRELHKKQFFAIEAEAQRLKEILTFITG